MNRGGTKLKNAVIKRIGRIFGHQKYQKFIIITRSRTGSNLLISLLNSHPCVSTEGEVFNRLNDRSWKAVWDGIFSKYWYSINTVGFKLFYYHPMDDSGEALWNAIQENQSIRIIHLVRKNMLRTYVSREIALKQDIWTSQEAQLKETTKTKKVEIDGGKCIEEFKRIQGWEQNTRERFSTHPFLEISYEDMVSDKKEVMQSVFDFLNVPNHTVSSELKKQNPESLPNLIENYDSLSKLLQEHGYGHLLEE